MEELVALINRAQVGDAEAYGVLVSRFQDMAYGYAYAILNDFHLAQDAAQEAFIEAYQCLPSLREEFAFPAWLKRIVHKHCDRLMRRKRLATAPLEAVAEVASSQPGPAELAERRELAQRVQEAIRELPDQQRVVTTLFYINGYSHQDIAEFLEVPAKTVKSRLHASRTRLRERMIDMVEDELKSNKLPEAFTKETVEQAVTQAKALNKDNKYNEAEELLRQVLPQFPEHPGALKELNHAVVQGRVYAESRFEMLSEVVEYGRRILQNTDDEYIHQQLAKTLLAIPAVPEAIEFLQGWIAGKGPSMERLGMLAWATCCTAEYEAAESIWQEVLALAQDAEADEVRRHVPFIAKTLVDCCVESDELARAQRVARQAWERCCDLAPVLTTSQTDLIGDAEWIVMFHQAKLDWQEIARVLLERFQGNADPRAQGIALGIRNWIDDPEVVRADWLDWVRARIAEGQLDMLGCYRAIGSGLQARGEWRAVDQLIRATWELLGQADGEEAAKQRIYWGWGVSHPFGAIEAGDWEGAEEMARRRIEERGVRGCGWAAVMVAAARGLPTSPDVVQAIEQGGVSSVDEYGMYGWYIVAREAAAGGDEVKAFDALRKALSYWTNPPLGSTIELWENDAYWGELRNHPEFKRAFDERRERVGPVYGELFYFPGW